ncbi:TIGR04141 family sporadically distributed protein [Actinosynnema sp. NPDC023587]|uniref:TIGR04141 family sporadically distributed protein n=1 Tax=Actinosynnema sp. NPDC023587 TaxID=3154695 RepID=UPI0033E38FEE
MTIYRFAGGQPPRQYFAFSEGVIIEYDGPTAIAGVQAHLVAGARAVDAASWGKHVAGITGEHLELSAYLPFTLIVVPVREWVVVAASGSGRRLLDDLRSDEGFGLRYALRRLDPTGLRTVGSHLLDISARVTQTSSPSGSTVPGFRIEPAGEQHQIRAGDSLTIQIGNSPETFLADLEELCRVVEESDENSPLRFLPQVRPLGDDDPLIPDLEGRLAVALGGDDRFGPLGLCRPSAAASAMDEANSFYTNSVGGLGPIDLDADLDIEAVTERFASIPTSVRVSELHDSRLMPCADEHGEELLTRPIPMDRWIAFETTIDTHTYCLHQGRWYEIGQDAVRQVRSQVAELLANKSDLEFPLWTPTGKSDDEHRYCEKVALQDGYLCLDKSFAHTPMHPTFELADVIGPKNEVVHVKWPARATAASHLVTQARVSAWAQRLEPAALEQLDAKVRLIDSRRRVAERPRVVVLAIAGRQWEVKQLFTLSMVDLLRLNEDLHHHGVELQFADIPFVAKKSGRSAPQADGEAA